MIRNYCFLFFLFLSIVLYGQDHQRISGDFKGLSFEQFAAHVERQTLYKFFFKKEWMDSVQVNISARSLALTTVLDSVLNNTDLQYAIEAERVYITKGRGIQTMLPPGFFEGQNNSDSLQHERTFDYSDYEQNEKLSSEQEGKIYIVGNRNLGGRGVATITGYIKDADTGEPLVGVSIYVEKPMVGVLSNEFGYYAITLAEGKQKIKIKSVGMKNTERDVMLYSNGKLDITMVMDIKPLKEVVVESQEENRISSVQMGIERLDIKTMKQIPLALGETDILKVVMMLPGVQSVGEGTTGLNVRGGTANQNLMLFNDAVVYNPSHLFGFFSTFNPDILKNVELYKSGINAEFGGRLSSVLDVKSREGNLKNISGSGGISPITGRFTLEGPIIKDRTSFILAGRSTYSDWLLKQVDSRWINHSEASFYDVAASVSHKIDDNNRLYVSGYQSQDRFRLKGDTTYYYSDRNASIKWQHIFTPKLYGVVVGAYSKYSFDIRGHRNAEENSSLKSAVAQWNTRAELNYFPNSQHTISGGITLTRYSLSPGEVQPKGEESLVTARNIENEQGVETALYVGDNFEINSNMMLYLGLRYSHYYYLGGKSIYQYAAGQPLHPANITDTVQYHHSESIIDYGGLEPRLSLRYSLTNTASLKISYNRMRQYIQMLSNTTAITPTDVWKLTDPYIKPQVGDQVSLGLYKNLKTSIETSFEVYYKHSRNVVDFKGGAVLLMNDHIETDVVEADGKAYGAEFLIKKNAGKVNGWISYTYARSWLKTASEFESDQINNGRFYPSHYDKPHSFNVIGNYKFSHRFNFSVNVVYSTGRPITLPIAKYDLNGAERLYYSDRNQYRIPDYFRTDISINLEGNHKVKKLAHSSWTLAVYNLTGRENAYSIFFTSQGDTVRGYKLSVFARPIPTITYNFKF